MRADEGSGKVESTRVKPAISPVDSLAANTPKPARGFGGAAAAAALEYLLESPRVVGGDLVEYNPSYDDAASSGARTALELVASGCGHQRLLDRRDICCDAGRTRSVQEVGVSAVLDVRLGFGAGPGCSHEERVAAAHRCMAEAMAKDGADILAVGIYGTTAIGCDGPYSDLDMTFITRTDLGQESAVTTRDGLLLNLDYQTWDESVEEARDPELAGTWADFLVLYDPDGLLPALRAMAEALTDDDYAQAFARKIADDVAANLGKIRNAVVVADRASFAWACQAYSEAVCRAISLRNRRYVTGRSRLREMTKRMPVVPPDYASLIDTVSGDSAATDQEIYDAAEALWTGIGGLPR